jgi:hypothetical protein
MDEFGTSLWDVVIVLGGFALLVAAKARPLFVVALITFFGACARLRG